MHAVKGGWLGQTFALAKRNDSEGRKSRIRRSKEERKTMVETFIKKYQESNKGSFPSLNLTHKEVGGSFYTVREIVRDIIQENRVLGPAKFTLEGHTSDQFLDQDPLASIEIDPQTYLVSSPNGNHHEPNKLQVEVEEIVLGQYTGAEHHMFNNEEALNNSQADEGKKEYNEAFGNGNPINGSQIEETNVESIETSVPDFQASDSLAASKDVEQDLLTPMSNLTPLTADVIVETFPLRPVTSTANRIESLGEFRDLSNPLDLHKGTKKSEQDSVELMESSNLSDETSVNDLGNVITKQNIAFGNEEEENHDGSTLVGSTKQTVLEEHFAHGLDVCADPQNKAPDPSIVSAKVVEQSQITDGNKKIAQDVIHLKSLTNTCTEESTTVEENLKNGNGQLGGRSQKRDSQKIVQDGIHLKNLSNICTEESTTIEENLKNVNGQLGGSSQKRDSPTLDRMNIESWDRTSKNSVKGEVNPLLAFFRSFVTAFVKFWSE